VTTSKTRHELTYPSKQLLVQGCSSERGPLSSHTNSWCTLYHILPLRQHLATILSRKWRRRCAVETTRKFHAWKSRSLRTKSERARTFADAGTQGKFQQIKSAALSRPGVGPDCFPPTSKYGFKMELYRALQNAEVRKFHNLNYRRSRKSRFTNSQSGCQPLNPSLFQVLENRSLDLVFMQWM